MSGEKEWNFNFGIYANDDSLISMKKCEELMNSIVYWAEKNDFSCGGGFDLYPENEYYANDDSCHCSNTPPMVMLSRYNKNPLVCLSCNADISPEKIKIDIEMIAKLQEWQVVYDCIDRLWLDSGTYEAWAMSELSKLESDVNKLGFEVQTMMQKYAKTYYWWFQNVGSKEKPLSFCPKCTQLLEKKEDKLICEKCLIVMQNKW